MAEHTGQHDDRDADAQVARVEGRRAAFGRRPGREPLVDPPVDLPLDPVDEALDELVVVTRPELGPGGEGRLELALGLAFHRRHDRRRE
jgi:hypothetical protein